MTNTRTRRLLSLVAAGRDTRQWYHLMYSPLILGGYVTWALGRGALTRKGKETLEQLRTNR